MKIKTVFSDFGLFADERANFFQYRRTDGRFIVRPLQPYLKNEHLELFRLEKEDGVFYAPVQLRRSGRKLVSRLMDVVGGHRFYKLLGEGLAFCEKGHLWRRGCRFEIREWRIFFPMLSVIWSRLPAGWLIAEKHIFVQLRAKTAF